MRSSRPAPRSQVEGGAGGVTVVVPAGWTATESVRAGGLARSQPAVANRAAAVETRERRNIFICRNLDRPFPASTARRPALRHATYPSAGPPGLAYGRRWTIPLRSDDMAHPQHALPLVLSDGEIRAQARAPIIERMSWALYDFSNTIFSMNVASLYFTVWLVEDLGVSNTVDASANAVASILVVLAIPFLGA